MREFILETYPIAKSVQVLGVANPKRRIYTHGTLARERKLDFARTGHALLQRGYLKKTTTNSFVAVKYIPVDVADEVECELNHIFNVSVTAQKLGLTRATLDALTKHGLVECHFKHPGATRGYHSDEIQRFLRAVTSNSQPHGNISRVEDWVPFPVAAKQCKCATWQVLGMVIYHNILVANATRNKTLICDYIVSADKLNSAFETCDAESSTVQTAANRLGMSTDAVEALIAGGKLAETPPFTRRLPRKTPRILNASIDRFASVSRTL